jgi:folate-dependent phosphoribosylglycinamide formyltransferase PurN
MTNALREHQKPFRYFSLPQQPPVPTRRHAERVRFAIITSVRDLASEGVGNRRTTRPGEEVYVKGTLEYALEQCVRGKLAHFLELVLVITDDTERDMKKLASPLPLRPTRELPWIHPLAMRTRHGELVSSITRNIQSSYRLLPLSDKGGRAAEKRRFEDRIRSAMALHGAQVLVSDHFLCRVEHLISPQFYDLQNKVLNIHPGISDRYHRFRTPGATPYADAIERAQGLRGPAHHRTGASFHIMEQEIDAGPVMVDVERTPVGAHDEWKDLCARNYPLSKNPAFSEGLIHYAQHIYPRLEMIDLNILQPFETDQPLYDRVA